MKTTEDLIGGAKMYRDILTMCWSIKEVNKNLADRKSTSDYSIKYLKKACSDLAVLMRDAGRSKSNASVEVIDKMGHKKSFALSDVVEMLYDTRKIVELNLIDNISRWARDCMAFEGK
ncbi:MAG: hypothetical protein QUS07_09975 [Methanothrix sp.]|nr:hypothetical protein [Methanothrix sp.]